jgi:hypothetical protein
MRAWWIVLMAAAGCGDDGNPAVDAAPDTPVDMAVDPGPCDLTAPFGTPVPVAGLTGAGTSSYGGWLSADELRIYFTRGQPGTGTQSMFTATRSAATDAFSNAGPLGIMNPSNLAMAWPMVSDDELTIYFHTTSTVMRATRAAMLDTFGIPEVMTELGVSGAGMTPHASHDGLSLQFGRIVTGNAELFTELSTTGYEESPVTSDDGLEVFFMRIPTGMTGGLYRAIRTSTSGPFAPPAQVAELGNGSLSPSWLSPDRCRLLFTKLDGTAPQILMAQRPAN